MPDETTQTTSAANAEAQTNDNPTAPEQPADTQSEGDAPPEAPESGITEDQRARYELLNERLNSGGFVDQDPPAEVEEQPQQVQRNDRAATQAAASGSFDTAGLSKAMTDQFGAEAGPIGKTIGDTINGLMGEIEGLKAQLEGTAGLVDEFGKLKESVEPVRDQVAQWTQREQRQRIREVHGWFDKQDGFSDRYGKGDPQSHTPAQRAWRQMIVQRASAYMADEEKRGGYLPLEEALAAAQYAKFQNQPSKAGATAAVRQSVQKQSRGISVDPARSAGNRPPANETPEQERNRKIKSVAAIFNGGGGSRR